MFLNLINRMILWELAKVFLLALVAITGILLMGGIIAEASQQGLGPAQVLAIIPLLIPSTLPFTIPATTLFATCLVYGRLAADNEILAIKAAGVNILRVVWPCTLLGLFLAAGTMTLYYRVIPYTHHVMRSRLLRDMQEVLYAMIKKDRGISHPKLDYSVFVRQVQGRKLIDATFKRRDKAGKYDVVIRAREAELEVDTNNRKLLVHMRYGEVWHEGGTYVSFLDRTEAVELPSIFGNMRPLRPRDMTWEELHESRASLEEQIVNVEQEIAQAANGTLPGHRPDKLPHHLKNLKDLRNYLRAEVRLVDIEYQMRPALSVGCLCFVLVGCPVGIWLSRSDYLSAFITCFLPIVFIYYPLFLCGTNMAKDGRLPVAASVWAADLIVALIGLPLYLRLLRN